MWKKKSHFLGIGALFVGIVLLLSCQKDPVETPVIGISGAAPEENIDLSAYVSAIIQSGGTPLVIPLTTDWAVLNKLLNRVDGLLLSNGASISPRWTDAQQMDSSDVILKRDTFEMRLAQKAVEMGYPILAINRGALMLNIAMGGTIFQDVAKELSEEVRHFDVENDENEHSIAIVSDLWMSGFFAEKAQKVCSQHRQGIKALAPCFSPIATSQEGLCEAYAGGDELWMGVQYDVEKDLTSNASSGKKIFDHFVNKARYFTERYRQ